MDDFEEECIYELGKDVYNKLIPLIEEQYENGFGDLETDDFTITCSIEKINVLQENVCVSITGKGFEIELLYENGVNNGTQLNEYSINPTSSFTNETRTYEEVCDVELDMEMTKALGLSVERAQMMLDNNRSNIMKNIKEKNYDYYVTGGGTNKTNRHYKSEDDKLHDLGLYWNYVTKTHTISANFN